MADSTVIALVFEDENAAERLFDTLEETLKTKSFPVDNAAIVVYKKSGETTVKQWSHPISENGFQPQHWEFLIKTVLSGWGHHIDNWSIEEFKQVFLPGTSAFFSLVEPSASRDVIIRLRQFNGKLIYAGLTEDQKALLKSAASNKS